MDYTPHPPPLSGILVNIILRFSIGLSNNENSYNGVGDDIIHAYVRLLSDMTSASNDDSYKKKRREDIIRATNFLEGTTLSCLQHEGKFTVKEMHEKLTITQ